MRNIDSIMLGTLLLLLLLLTCGSWGTSLTFHIEPSDEEMENTRSGRRSVTDSESIDDKVLQLAYQTAKANIWKAKMPYVTPALTDKTFPTTVYNTSAELIVILFYIPFDPVSTLFLKEYEEAGRELTARGMGSNSSTPSHPLVRVNCYDWTDVCRKENITTYPIIHLYQQGKWREQYRDALDKDVLVRTVSLLQCGQPLWLRQGEWEVQSFLDGHLPDNVHPLVDNLVLLKPSASLTEVAAFTEVVRQLETQMLFGIVSPEVETQTGIEVGVLHVRRSDKYQPYDTLTQNLDTDSIRQFLLNGKFELLPELTFRNFPELYSRRQPMGILFLNPAHDQVNAHVRAVVDVITSQRVKNVTFCTIGVDGQNEMASTLLRTYTGRLDLPVFVLVDFQNSTVFTFTKWTLTNKKIQSWILAIQAGKISPTSRLPEGNWKPAGEHFDFLGMMDREKAEKQNVINKRRSSQSDHPIDHYEEFHDRGLVGDPEDEDFGDHEFETVEYFELPDGELPSQEKLLEYQAKLNQNQQSWTENQDQNQNKGYPNQNQHRPNQNEHPHTGNKNRNSPNQKSMSQVPKKMRKMNLDGDLKALENEEEKGRLASSRAKKSFKTLSKDKENMDKEPKRRGKRLKLHTEL